MKDGGPAFPVECSWTDGEPKGMQTGNALGWATGMSLRDYFAAAALQALVTREMRAPTAAAEQAYVIADAMLAERDKP